jgi:hypothetical protein
MTITAKTLIAPLAITNAQTTQYTTPASTRTIIDKFTATNTSGSAATISVNLVTSGGAAAATNLIISAKSLTAGECYTCPELVGHILDAGGFISTIAGTTTVITVRASGREIT